MHSYSLCYLFFIVFRAFDHNGDGSISRDELLDAMRRFGHSFSEAECDEMFTQVRGGDLMVLLE